MHRTRADFRRSICGSKSLLSAIVNSSIEESLPLFWRERRANASLAGTGTVRRSSLPAQQQVDGTGAAVAGLGRCNRKNSPAQPGRFEPARHRALEHARTIRTEPAPGDDQHAAPPLPVRSPDKVDEFPMGFGLGHTVEIETRVDRVEAALQPLGVGSVDTRKSVERLTSRTRSEDSRGLRYALLRRRGHRLTARQRGHVARRKGPQCSIVMRRHYLTLSPGHPSLPNGLQRQRYGAAAAHARPEQSAARYRRCATAQ